MEQGRPLLYIIFSKADNVSQRLSEASRRAWTAPKNAKPGDIALFYFGGPNRGIYAVGRTATESDPGVPDNWTESEHGYFAEHRNITALRSPLYSEEIRKAFPGWKRWSNLFGVRVHIVPIVFRQRLAELIVAKNPATGALLVPWLPVAKARILRRVIDDREPSILADAQLAIEGLRTEAVAYRHGRSRVLRNRALVMSKGICQACAVDFSTLLGGKGVRVLQVHHRKQLASTDKPRLTKLSDLAVVCANCHTLIHSHRKHSLSVKELRTMLERRAERTHSSK